MSGENVQEKESVGTERKNTYKQFLRILSAGDIVSFNNSTTHATATGESKVEDASDSRVNLKESESVYYTAYIDDMELKETDENGETHGWYDILTIELLAIEGSD